MVILYFYYIYLPSLILLYSDICIVCVGLLVGLFWCWLDWKRSSGRSDWRSVRQIADAFGIVLYRMHHIDTDGCL